MKDFLVVIPTRTNIDGLKNLTSQLGRLQIPLKIYDNGHETYSAQAFLHSRNDVVNARTWRFYKMWNHGCDTARNEGYAAVALLNDDITICDDSLQETYETLMANHDYGLLGLNWKRRVEQGVVRGGGIEQASGTYRRLGIGGWAFMLKTETWANISPIDELYNIWYGDDELFALVEDSGSKTGLAKGAPVDHQMSSTLDLFPELMAKTGADRERFVRRWGNR